MEYLAIAEIEIDGNLIEHFTSAYLKQNFNEHHEFAVRLNYDVIDSSGSLAMNKAQEKIGKSIIIKLIKIGLGKENAYQFRGLICEVRLENAGMGSSDLVIAGYSPTILLENGPNLSSFYKSDLQKIIDKLAKPLSDFDCEVSFNNKYKKPITYICQYKESAFQFINRLSNDFGEFFYYDGQTVYFGKPTAAESLEVAYGEEINSMQLSLKLQPMTFTNYAYLSKDDKVVDCESPSSVDGLGQYAGYILNESNMIFSEPVIMPVKQRVESKSDLQDFAKKRKSAMASQLEVVTCTSCNPAISLGGTINLKISKFQNNSFIKEDYGEYLVTGIEHFISENARYYNRFEAIPAVTEILPVNNVIVPIAEPQIAIVKDNKDPDGQGRVRVQMLWQKDDNMTDWIRVMTPDAGGGKDGAKNRGLVVIPEKGDQVLVCFRYNDPDRPFVMGSLFHGKSGGGGGEGNKSKSLIALSGSKISLDDKSITIVDAEAKSKIFIDGAGNIQVESSDSIVFNCGDSSVSLKKDGTIDITGKKITVSGTAININGSDSVDIASGPASFHAEKGGDAKMNGTKSTVTGTAEVTVTGAKATLNGDATADVSSMGPTAIAGAIVKLN